MRQLFFLGLVALVVVFGTACGGDDDEGGAAQQAGTGDSPEKATKKEKPGTEGAIWTRQFGSPRDDGANGLGVDSSGNVYLVGTTSGELLGQTSRGFADAWVSKYDSEGNELWTHQYGSTEGKADSGADGAVDAEGNLYTVGRTSGSLTGTTNIGNFDGYLRKYSTDGQEVFTVQFGTEKRDEALRVALDAQGNIYVAGETRGAFEGHTAAGKVDVFLRKHDPTGQEIWTIQYGSDDTDSAKDLTVDAEGNVYVTGSTLGVLGDFSKDSVDTDAYVIKFDSSGKAVWTQQFGSGEGESDASFAVATDKNGNVFLVGRVSGALPDKSSWGGIDAYVRKLDSGGNHLWTEQFGSDQGLLDADSAFGATTDSDGNVYVTGATGGHLPGLTAFRANDVWLRKYDPQGEELWSRQFGSDEADEGSRVALDQDGNVFVVGQTAGELPGLEEGAICVDKLKDNAPCKLRDAFVRKYLNE